MRIDFKSRIEDISCYNYKDTHKLFVVPTNYQIIGIDATAHIEWYATIYAKETGIKSIDSFVSNICLSGELSYIDNSGEIETIDIDIRIPKSWNFVCNIEPTSGGLYISDVQIDFEKKEVEII